MKTYLKTISLSIAAAALLVAGSARADDEAGNAAWEAGESANPHAVENRNQKTELVDAKISNDQAVLAESENPHNVTQSHPETSASEESIGLAVRRSEAGNPHAVRRVSAK